MFMLDLLENFEKIIDYANLNKKGIMIMANKNMIRNLIINVASYFTKRLKLTQFQYVCMNQKLNFSSDLPIYIPFQYNLKPKLDYFPIDQEILNRLYREFEMDHIEYCLENDLPILIYNILNVPITIRPYLISLLSEPYIFHNKDNTIDYRIVSSLNYVEFNVRDFKTLNEDFDRISLMIRSRYICIKVFENKICIDPLFKDKIN